MNFKAMYLVLSHHPVRIFSATRYRRSPMYIYQKVATSTRLPLPVFILSISNCNSTQNKCGDSHCCSMLVNFNVKGLVVDTDLSNLFLIRINSNEFLQMVCCELTIG